MARLQTPGTPSVIAYDLEMAAFDPPLVLRGLLARVTSVAGERGMRPYAVGGTVRDSLLRRPMRDLDIAVDGDALACARALAEALGGHYVALDDANGVARVVLGAQQVAYIDVAALQGTLEQDLRRRDFTIDAMAAPLAGGNIVDPCDGERDLRAGAVRMNAANAFGADPLRMLRAARLAGELDFTIEPVTRAAIVERAPKINDAAAERRRDEMARIFALRRVEPSLRLLDELRLLDALLPELGAGRGVSQPANHHAYDVFEHGLHTLEAMDLLLEPERPAGPRAWMWDALWDAFLWCEERVRAYLAGETKEGRSRAAILKLATLLHDVAKPHTRTVDEVDGRIRFFGHAETGARMTAEAMRRLRFSAREVAFVSLLVEEHLRPVQLAQAGEAPTLRALYRFHRDLGDAVPAVLLLALADAAGSRGPRMTSEGWSRHVLYMNSLLVRLREAESIVSAPRLLTGHDIMSEFGVGEGPLVGRLLEELREAQVGGDVREREQALAFVRARIRGLEGTQAGTG